MSTEERSVSEEYRGSELELAHRQIGDYVAALEFVRERIRDGEANLRPHKLVEYIEDALRRIERMTVNK